MADQIDLLFSDLLGLAHGKTVPLHRQDHPTHYAITVMVQGLDLGFLETANYSTSAGFPDMEARIDSETIRPWGNRSCAMSFLHFADGRPLPLDPRRALASVCDRWNARGLTPMAGFEMEFFLLSGRDPLTKLPVPDHRVYGIGAGADPSGTLEAIAEAAEECNLKVEGVNSEFTPSQVEVSLRYQEALTAADAAFLFRQLAREVARENDIDVTFMARPFADAVGNGMHVNLSMSDATGHNALVDETAPHGMSTLSRHMIAGLLEHHEALAAFAAPTVNSYKRLTPGMLSGYWANWGLDNRVSSVRVPGQRGSSTRIEHRSADGSASPHLLTAALLAAALDGIERKLEPPAPSAGNAEENPGEVPAVAANLGDALAALEADKILVDALGDDLTNVFTTIKRAEIARWEQAVTDWEVTTYGRVY